MWHVSFVATIQSRKAEPRFVGRDILVRVIFAARASLMAGVISVAIAVSVGVPLGLTAGYLGGFFEALIGRMTDAMLPAL